jgi:hypothetical protein
MNYFILQKCAMQTGVLHCSPHAFRRTSVAELLAKIRELSIDKKRRIGSTPDAALVLIKTYANSSIRCNARFASLAVGSGT